MPTRINDFTVSPIGFSVYRNGAVETNPSTVNLDTSSGGTGQALSNQFTIPDTPEGSPDKLWDEIKFTFDWESANTSISPTLTDGARVIFGLTKNNNFTGITFPYGTQGITLIPEADATVSVQNGTATVTFTNVAPGTYRLFAGESNAGDGERLLVNVTDAQALEVFPCFGRTTQIETVDGSVAVENLSVGTLIATKNGPKPIRWIGSRKLPAELLSAHPKLRPIRIKAGALGENLPEIDLIVSPQHRVLVRSSIAQRMFDFEEVLVAAKQLLELDGVDIADDLAEVEYFHVMLDRHEIIISNGAETESLYAGKQALLAVGEAAREEIFTIFPDLKLYPSDVTPAAMLVPGRQARKLAQRHKKNAQALSQ